jgi:hypothetical protein
MSFLSFILLCITLNITSSDEQSSNVEHYPMLFIFDFISKKKTDAQNFQVIINKKENLLKDMSIFNEKALPLIETETITVGQLIKAH